MNILIVGASGATGIELTEQALERDYRVTVLLRSPENFYITHKNLHIVKGDATDKQTLADVIAGKDAVLVALGPRSLGKTSVQEAFARNAVDVMQKAGVMRLVDLSAWGSGENNDKMRLGFKIIRNTLLKNVFDDKEHGEKIILASSLDYTMVQPGRLLNQPERGNVGASLDGEGLSFTIARADVARFMLDQLSDTTWSRKSPLVGYNKR